MGGIAAGLVSIGVLLFCVAIGMPVAIAMGIVAAGGMMLFGSMQFMATTMQTLPFALGTEYGFLVVPMFILMGALTSAAGITRELYTAAYRWTAGIRGSLYYATTLASAAFGAINGSTVVSAVLFTRIALPEMLRFKYDRGLSAGCICAAGTFAALIPPSVSMVLYAILTGESVGALLMAGVLPGILTAGIYLVGLRFLIGMKPHVAPPATERFTLLQKLESMRGLWAVVVLVAIVMGGIYTGLLFPSAAGTAGAIGALLIGLARRKLGWPELWDALKRSASTTAVLFLIIIAGLLFSRLLLVNGFIADLTDVAKAAGLTPFRFVVIVVVMYLILGMFIDTVSMMVMTIPFLFPIAKALGVDPIWFGVIIVKLVEIAAISPPVGLNLFAVISAAEGKVSMRELFVGVVPFLLFEAVTLGLLLQFQEISLWLPRQMVH